MLCVSTQVLLTAGAASRGPDKHLSTRRGPGRPREEAGTASRGPDKHVSTRRGPGQPREEAGPARTVLAAAPRLAWPGLAENSNRPTCTSPGAAGAPPSQERSENFKNRRREWHRCRVPSCSGLLGTASAQGPRFSPHIREMRRGREAQVLLPARLQARPTYPQAQSSHLFKPARATMAGASVP